ncbi:MAG: SMC-Scp complex subunit ScpB [Gammaproteobacteria bacterium RBG_16_37_9]|nr:MAG: SMC-Scp complex subunit ScpB [Gammaproteobacteria bacterium RBG_16_37_9]
MAEITPKQIIEALLMASEEPLNIERLHKIFISNNFILEINALRDIINELVEEYADRGIELKEVASGWRFQIKSDLSQWVNKLYEERPPRYSHALLETLALIAYRQPITRAEIEGVRGVVVSSNIVKTLLEHEWIRIIGHKEVPGRPALFATTKKFLDHFNLKHLDELPPLMEFTETLAAETKSEEISEMIQESEQENLSECALFDPYEGVTLSEKEEEITSY